MHNTVHLFPRRVIAALFTAAASILTTPSLSQNFPVSTWDTLQHPEKSGWVLQRLDSLRTYIIDSTHVTGFMIVQHDSVVMEFGDVKENSYIASCRKSILSMLYGEHVNAGTIKLSITLKELGIEDIGGLLPVEKEATIMDIISSRSGVFHPASNSGDYLDLAPKRGSVKHSEYWLYSNWDFNVAGYIFEKLTHKRIYDEVERVLAVPLHMQDWTRALQHKDGDTTRSHYKAYPMWFSTRDMARIGLLMLHNGRWGDKQVVDPGWIREMLTPRTQFTEVNKNVPIFPGTPYGLGYGYMWWLWQNMHDPRFDGGYSALGALGQAIAIFPAIDAVIVYKTKADYERVTSGHARMQLLVRAVKSIEIVTPAEK